MRIAHVIRRCQSNEVRSVRIAIKFAPDEEEKTMKRRRCAYL